MDRRYQVFVSSTYADLAEERREVIQALLELDCIPAGMELFPAADDDQWTLIKQVIDDCDYYIVVVGGRYGSVDQAGMSFTEKEYRYALETKKPIIGFVHNDKGKIQAEKVDTDPPLRKKLQEFEDLVKQKPVRFWGNPQELGSMISRSLVKLIKSHPSPGWVRADNLPDESASQEILRLRKEIDRLNGELSKNIGNQPEEAVALAQGTDSFEVGVDVSWRFQYRQKSEAWTTSMHWNEIVFAIAPILIDVASSQEVRNKLSEYISSTRRDGFLANEEIAASQPPFKVVVQPGSLDTIIVQLTAIGVIRKSGRSRSVNDKNTYWELTPYGEKLMYELRAIRRDPGPQFGQAGAVAQVSFEDEAGIEPTSERELSPADVLIGQDKSQSSERIEP